MYIILSWILLSRLHILGIVLSIGLALFDEVVMRDLVSMLAGHTTFAPQRIGVTLRTKTLLLCMVATSSFGILCVYFSSWHMASFNIVVASFGCPTFTPLSHADSHDYAFGFWHNRRFGSSILHLKATASTSQNYSFQFGNIPPLDCHGIVRLDFNRCIWTWRVASRFNCHATCGVVVDEV